ncbi:hypothetical protein MFRU_005g01110 [Monilinia fructicola]|nr:hypothetical protein MFRU_005g01110 [Monilinia fructicola]
MIATCEYVQDDGFANVRIFTPRYLDKIIVHIPMSLFLGKKIQGGISSITSMIYFSWSHEINLDLCGFPLAGSPKKVGLTFGVGLADFTMQQHLAEVDR